MTLFKDVPVCLTGRDLAFNQDIKALIPNNSADPLFLCNYLRSKKRKLLDLVDSAGHGTGRIDSETLKLFPVPLPPLPEQKAIARILECWETAIINHQIKLEKKRNIKIGLMQRLLSRKQRLPGFTGDGVQLRLEAVADVKTGPFGAQLHERDYASSGSPIITVEHLSERGILHKNLPLVSDEDKQRLSQYVLSEGDIVFSRVGSVDRNSLVSDREDGWLFSGRLLRVRPKPKKVTSLFLSQYFQQHAFKHHMRCIAVGGTMACLNTKLLSRVQIDIPPFDEQIAISAILSAADAEIIALERKLTALKDQKRYLLNNLVTGAIRLPQFVGKE